MLEAADLQCERGGRTLFRNLSLSLPPGELLRICGPNGSGKTSLLKILCGLLPPAAGEVRWQGRSIRSLREEYSRQLLYLGHAPAVKDELTAAENLRIACTLAGLSVSAEEVAAAVGRFGIPADTALRQLSQGQRRRAALARLALSGKVPLWLLDEPFTALDAAGATLLDQQLAELAGATTLLLSTHDPTRVERLATIRLALA
jgi:heme exporter protein A